MNDSANGTLYIIFIAKNNFFFLSFFCFVFVFSYLLAIASRNISYAFYIILNGWNFNIKWSTKTRQKVKNKRINSCNEKYKKKKIQEIYDKVKLITLKIIEI